MRCCIAGCKNKYPENKSNVKFYYFPKNSTHMPWLCEKRKTWIDAVKKYVSTKRRNDWLPSRNTVICNAHFFGNRKSENPKYPSYIPTIFPGEENVASDSTTQQNDKCNSTTAFEYIDVPTNKETSQQIKSEENILKTDIKPDPELDIDNKTPIFGDITIKSEKEDTSVAEPTSKHQEGTESIEIINSSIPENSIRISSKENCKFPQEPKFLDMNRQNCVFNNCTVYINGSNNTFIFNNCNVESKAIKTENGEDPH